MTNTVARAVMDATLDADAFRLTPDGLIVSLRAFRGPGDLEPV